MAGAPGCAKTDVSAGAPVEPARLLCFSNDADIENVHSDQLGPIGNCWLRPFNSLTALDCTGLTELTTVGDGWLRDCTRLTALNCEGLTHLTAVGDSWLHDCTGLTSLDCTGLSVLTTVGDC